ncbi:hypothetical protein [Reyranella sp.]
MADIIDFEKVGAATIAVPDLCTARCQLPLEREMALGHNAR